MAKRPTERRCWVCGIAPTTNTCDRCSRGLPTLTLWQPWASLIAAGFKTIETRTHDKFAGLKHRRIAIHAGRRYHNEADDMIRRYSAEAMRWMKENLRGKDSGRILCTAFVLDARPLQPFDSKTALCDAGGLHGLILDRIQVFDFRIIAKGQQGIWKWTPQDRETDEREPCKQNNLFDL